MLTTDFLLRRRMMMEGRSPLPPPPDMSRTPLTFDILSDGNITLVNYGNDPYVFEYSKNSGEWTEANSGSNNEDWAVIPVVSGDELRFRGTAWPGTNSCRFGSTCEFSVKGNPSSLKYGDVLTGNEALEEGCLLYLFCICNGLISAENLALPATTLAKDCYSSMFDSCTGLTTAPELPATILAEGCYDSMFFDCTSLTEAPELPATTLAYYCYSFMFSGCTSLNSVKCLATDISANHALSSWLDSVAASDTFTKAAGVTWPSGSSGIPSGWTVVEV